MQTPGGQLTVGLMQQYKNPQTDASSLEDCLTEREAQKQLIDIFLNNYDACEVLDKPINKGEEGGRT